jgi:hypothetical protein
MNIPDYFTESLKAVFWFKILIIFDADPEAGIRNLFDPGSVMGLLPYVLKKNRHLPRPPPPPPDPIAKASLAGVQYRTKKGYMIRDPG